jgi:hypothetical protein
VNLKSRRKYFLFLQTGTNSSKKDANIHDPWPEDFFPLDSSGFPSTGENTREALDMDKNWHNTSTVDYVEEKDTLLD